MLLVLAVFLVSNRAAVTVDFWPFGLLGSFPLGAIILITLGVGVLIGLLMHWPYRLRARRRARIAERQVASLQAELAVLRAETAPPQAVPALAGPSLAGPSLAGPAPPVP